MSLTAKEIALATLCTNPRNASFEPRGIWYYLSTATEQYVQLCVIATSHENHIANAIFSRLTDMSRRRYLLIIRVVLSLKISLEPRFVHEFE